MPRSNSPYFAAETTRDGLTLRLCRLAADLPTAEPVTTSGWYKLAEPTEDGLTHTWVSWGKQGPRSGYSPKSSIAARFLRHVSWDDLKALRLASQKSGSVELVTAINDVLRGGDGEYEALSVVADALGSIFATPPLVITRDCRHGNDEASYYVKERAELKQREGKFAFLISSDGISDGLHSPDGLYIGGNPEEWSPVSVNEVTPEIQAIVSEWTEGGWAIV